MKIIWTEESIGVFRVYTYKYGDFFFKLRVNEYNNNSILFVYYKGIYKTGSRFNDNHLQQAEQFITDLL